MTNLRLYTQFENIIPTLTADAVKALEKATGATIRNEQELAIAYRSFEATRVANGGYPSPFKILDPPQTQRSN